MKWKLKDVLFMAISAAIFGVIYLATVYIGGAISGALTPLGWGVFGYTPMYGVYFMSAVFVTYIVRKPGIGILAELIAALVEVLLGNYFGPSVIINGLLQGGACEIVFLATRYKKWNMGTTILSSISVAIISFIYEALMDGYYLQAAPIFWAMLIVRILSSIVFTGILAKLLADALNKAGVLRGFAISGASKDLYEE